MTVTAMNARTGPTRPSPRPRDRRTAPRPGRADAATVANVSVTIELTLPQRQLHAVEDRSASRRRSGASPEPKLEAILRRAWDWLQGVP